MPTLTRSRAHATLIAVLLTLVLIAIAGCTKPDQTTIGFNSGGGGTCTLSDAAALPAGAQLNVAEGIVTAAGQLGVSERGITIAFAVALTESGMKVINFGDFSSNGQMTTSRGPFQQKDAWGPLADRLDPVKSATMFFNGGAAGQQGLLDIAGWESMPMHEAAQAVQRSQYTSGSNFAAQMSKAEGLAAGLTCTAPTSPGGNVSVTYAGVSVTIPDHPDVVPAVRGKVIQAPSEQMAKGIAAGFGALGLPYVWGGGGSGAGPNDGCVRGGGDYNSCQGLTGFDCSGLTAYVYVQGGLPSPGGNSGAQRAGGVPVSYDQGRPGDIVGFPGHVAIFLGVIDGQQYILEASWVGTPIHVVPLTRGDRDGSLHRYWGTSTV